MGITFRPDVNLMSDHHNVIRQKHDRYRAHMRQKPVQLRRRPTVQA